MTGIGRRVDALEAIAREVRARPVRELTDRMARKEHLTPAETEEAYAEALRCLDIIDGWRREGLTDREILQRYADAELEAQCEEAERYFDGAA